MTRVRVSQSEFLSLKLLAYKAKMSWFEENYKNRKTVNIQDLEDLSTALQNFTLCRICQIYDLYNIMAVFSRAKLCNNDIFNAKSFMRNKYLKDKYLERLSGYGKYDGYRDCPVDNEDIEEVRKIFSDDHYYFTTQDGETWLNWE